MQSYGIILCASSVLFRGPDLGEGEKNKIMSFHLVALKLIWKTKLPQ